MFDAPPPNDKASAPPLGHQQAAHKRPEQLHHSASGLQSTSRARNAAKSPVNSQPQMYADALTLIENASLPFKNLSYTFFWVYHYIFQIKAFLCVVTKLSLLAVAKDEHNNSNLSVCNDRENETDFLVLSGGLPPAVSFFTAMSLTFSLEASLALRIYPQCTKQAVSSSYFQSLSMCPQHQYMMTVCMCICLLSLWV